ncbi:hypothetical protein SEUCBS140593_009570 [Sporothrix eucalyptigena]|uniref:Uncharacterized protein n=1 Tax=Sporothrix eucalyptigena TaxID=1812306 RepID=A0ABP0CVZ0_9PEZI
MAVDFSDEFETSENQEQQEVSCSEEMVTPELSEENKPKKNRRSWLRWGKEEDRQTPTPDHAIDGEDVAAIYSRDRSMGIGSYDDSALGNNRNQRPPSRSSSIISRTMSLTAQLERSLSLKISKLSRTSVTERPTVPISAFSTARKNQALSPSLPSPLFAEAMEQQRRAMTPESLAVDSPPASIRMQQIRPSMLRVPPPLRPQSTPPSETGSRRVSRQSSQDSLYNSASAQYNQTSNLASSVDYNDVSHIASAIVASPPPLDSPLHPTHSNWDAQAGYANSGPAVGRRRGSSTSSHRPHRSFSGSDAHTVSMSSSAGVYMNGNGSQDGQARVIRHRASFNGYTSDMNHSWDGGNHAAPQHHPQQYNPPRMSNGYTGPVLVPYGSGHRRNGSASSSRSDIYQLQQQQVWDYYYQQYARPPPNVPRGSHHRNRSMGSRHGPVPGPQAPYRILHSYNSPAYRGVPIWG